MIPTDARPDARPRAPYTPPVLEALGEWSTLTLQQTIVITGVFPADPEAPGQAV